MIGWTLKEDRVIACRELSNFTRLTVGSSFSTIPACPPTTDDTEDSYSVRVIRGIGMTLTRRSGRRAATIGEVTPGGHVQPVRTAVELEHSTLLA